VYFSDLYEFGAAVSELTPWSGGLYEKIVIIQRIPSLLWNPEVSRLFIRGHCQIPS
jgi:hypothetical protein